MENSYLKDKKNINLKDGGVVFVKLLKKEMWLSYSVSKME